MLIVQPIYSSPAGMRRTFLLMLGIAAMLALTVPAYLQHPAYAAQPQSTAKAAPTRQTRTALAPVPADSPAPLQIIERPNPHYTARAQRNIDTVVVHFISGINVAPARWSDPDLAMKILRDNRVSAHYLIDRDGVVYRLVDEMDIAWHAGGSVMPAPDNRQGVNRFSIGIEMIATKDSGFTDAQYDALAALLAGIQERHPIRHIVGHDEIAGTRAVRMGLRRDVKPDPGAKFEWSRVPGR